MKMPKPIQFKIRIPKNVRKIIYTKRYYQIMIFATRAQMHFYYREHCKRSGQKPDDKFSALTMAFEHWIIPPKGRKIRKPIMGNVIIHWDMLRSGIISHEMTHATNYFFLSEYGYEKLHNKRLEEYHAYIQGSMVAQFWTAYYKRLDQMAVLKEYANHPAHRWENDKKISVTQLLQRAIGKGVVKMGSAKKATAKKTVSKSVARRTAVQQSTNKRGAKTVVKKTVKKTTKKSTK